MSTTAAPPTVIEVALNGMTTKEQNPYVPRTVYEIVEDGVRCLEAGASVVHHHNDEPNFGGATRHCAGPHIEVWRQLRASRPGRLLHPTMAGATADSTIEERFAHVVELYDAGLAPVATCDAGGLAAYLDMLEDTGLTWMAAVYGGDVTASGIAALAIERGGHVRVGLEDHRAPPRLARNEELVAELAALCRAAGRPPATIDEAPKLLFG